MGISASHREIQNRLLAICERFGYEAVLEYPLGNRRADVLATRKDGKKVVFEVQLSRLTTAESRRRRDWYVQHGIIFCWLVKDPPQIEVHPAYPFFRLEESGHFLAVDLGDMRKVGLDEFVAAFLQDCIRFNLRAWSPSAQEVELIFFEKRCRSCGAVNHPFCVSGSLRTPCGLSFPFPDDRQPEYRHEITARAREIAYERELNPANIFHDLVSGYSCFECYRCSRPFASRDIVMSKVEAFYGYDRVCVARSMVELDNDFVFDYPHWCYAPDGLSFCDSALEKRSVLLEGN